MRVALRVEVRSRRGLREGVPNLMRLFSQYSVRATFFFPLGMDYTGRSPLRAWRERRRLGWPALAYGTLLRAPSLREDAARQMAAARADGHEVGLFGLSPWCWMRHLAHAEQPWVEDQCRRLWDAFLDSGGTGPTALATPGWQVNPALLAALNAGHYRFSSISRGKLPYLPQLQGVRSPVPEIPTTLPTVDELLRRPDVSAANAHEYLYAESQHLVPAGHVFAVSAEGEGLERPALLEKLLVMWKGYDGAVRTLGDLLAEIDIATLPHHQVGWGTVEGGERYMAMQSVQVPA